jgi:O-acetyl-ADP-ribose deacetylase (regulator of RNase III)
LASCYKNCLILAKKYKIKTIAFPAISTGVYGYPKKEAAEIAVATVKNFIEKDNWFEEIRFVVFSDESFKIYKEILSF